MDYLYDGSFDGLLTCVYYNYYREKANGIYYREGYQPSLADSSCDVVTNPDYAHRVYKAIEEKLSGNSLHNIYHTFLSSCPDKENLILNYLRLGFRLGAKLDSYHTHPDVQPLHKTARKVTLEVHRLLGLLRFSDNGKFLHAKITPDHNILPLLADHFAERLKNERWLIEDCKRYLAVIYDGQNKNNRPNTQRPWYLLNLEQPLDSAILEQDPYEELWKLYFYKICIDSRRNPRLQAQFVPYRYRKHLVEFQPYFNDNDS
ncbi:TIGR03915 family putative DNA repair protein [Syntrophomonas palmitatica]|uniref:TIGR03915 family putative DNA repair protein n=1 Tax=Syntrophomonas palmitatica TaxID=402877 RepID=UPI0006D1FF81|nr:TIGR03915 family putative DNA repair protein [Syntrophomonas palmitatica]